MSEPSPPQPKHPGGRPRTPVDVDAAERAASIGCTNEEIAAVVGVSRTIFYERAKNDPAFAEALERGRSTGKATLRRMQWQRATGGSDTMLIWLGKQMLGQRDRQEHTGADGGPIVQRIERVIIDPSDTNSPSIPAPPRP